MARYYSDENIKILMDDHACLRWRSFQLQQRYMEYNFRNEQAKEFARHGFSRRLGTLVRCIDNTFCAIPPELDGVPTSHQTEDVTIQVQAFSFNVFGCLDNLAWVWVLERNITKPDGMPLPPEWIGLRTVNKAVRDSLGQELRSCLESEDFSAWFKYLEDYRHALAHRIPLYVPPFSIAPDNESKLSDLEQSIWSLVKQRKAAEVQAQKMERERLKFFQPCIMHSWTGQARPIFFHTQMLTDFKTIEMISAKLLDDLARPPG
jgi:hypothetical protein